MSPSAASPVRTAASAGWWVPCRRCGQDRAVPVIASHDRLLGIPGEFRVVRCGGCGFLYTNPQPDDEALTLHYPSTYPMFETPAPSGPATRGRVRHRLRAAVLAARGYLPTGRHPGPLWVAAGRAAASLLAQRFQWLPPFVPGGTLVEVGCATGGYLAEMQELGWRVIGVEPNRGAAAASRQRGLDVRTGTLEEAGLPEGSADVVVMRMVLEHVRDPRATLAEVRRVVRPGGLVLLSVPNAGSVEARLFGRHWFAWELPRHLSHFTPRSLAALVREAGFGQPRIRHLVNANNLAHSRHYRRGGTGSPGGPGAGVRMLAVLAAAARTAGRISVEARALPVRPIRCAICGPGAGGIRVFEGTDLLAGVPGRWEVVRCTRCGLLATRPQPSTLTEVAALYPRSYPTYHRPPDVGAPARLTGGLRAGVRAALLARRGYPIHPLPRGVFRIAAALTGPLVATRMRRFPQFVPGGLVIDVGCGPGHELAELRDRGWRVAGVELDRETARRAAAELRIDVHPGTLEDARLPDACADVVILRHVLEHLPDPAATLAEIRRVLRPRGRLLVELPNAGGWEARAFGPWWRGWELPRHLYHFTPRTVRALLHRSGFQDVTVRQVPSARTILASLRLALETPRWARGAVRQGLARLNTPLSVALAPAAWAACRMRRSGLIWVEARGAERR